MPRSQKVRTETVKVTGLRELSRALKNIGPEAQKELREASRTVAGFVASDAAAAARSLGGVAAHVAPSISPVGGVSSAGVAFGGSAYPMAGGAEFGSVRFKQFKPWLGHKGYFPYPQIVDNEDRIVEEFTGAVNKVIEKRFPQ